jgi:hypothetical protein
MRETTLYVDGVVADPDALVFASYRKTALTQAVKIPVAFAVDTLEGTMTGRAGDYLMRGPAGELYPCAVEVFCATYKPAP